MHAILVLEFRVLLASRNLFRNWFSAGIRYYLIKHGLIDGNITVRFRCGDGGMYVLGPWVYSLIVNAYYDGLFRLVCDGGLFVGDTALYYARRGAFVVTVEPLPSNL